MKLQKSTVIECVASTSDKDVTGESLHIDGADISPLLEGRGFVNSDHRNDFAHLVGTVKAARIVKSLQDCETPTQIKFWNELGRPYLWCKAELWDGSGHKEADSIAAIYKFYGKKNEKPPIKVSVEGKTLERGPNGLLKRTLIKGIALTVHPCNRTTRTEVTEITKSMGVDAASLIKSEDAVVPSFIEISDETDRMNRVYQLAVVARQLLRKAVEQSSVSKAEENKGFELKSPALLERLKQLMSSVNPKA